MRLELLKDIADIIAGQSPPSESYNKSGEGIPFFQGMADYGEKFPAIRNWCLKPTKISQPNDILISVRAPVGPVNINNVEACIGRGLSAIRAKKNYHYEYIYYFLKANIRQIANLGVGSTFTAITQKDLGNIQISVPETLSDQIKIASLLSKAEELIRQRIKSINLLDEFLKSTFLKMFGDPVRNEKNWKIRSLKEIVKIGTGGTPSRQRESEFYNGNINWAKTTEVNGNYIYTTEEKITELAIKESNCKVYPVGTILLAMYGQGKTRGNVGYLKIPAATNQACAAIPPNENINQIFLFELLKQLYSHLRGLARGGNQENLNLNIVGNVNIVLPEANMQNQFALIVDKVEVLKEQFTEGLNDLENLYASLSQRAFKGKLDLSSVKIDQSLLKDIDRPKKQPKDLGAKKIQEALDAATSIAKHFEKVTNLSKAVNRFNIYFESWNKLNAQLKALPKLPEAVIKAQKNVTEIQKAFSNIPAAMPKSKGKITWDSVSSEQIANLIKENYTGFHFTSEMMERFLTEEHVIFPKYYSSEELKKNPKANDADDFKTFIFSALNDENPFLKLDQIFYNAEADNLTLTLRGEDFELIKDRNKSDRTGIYLRITE
jgi:type I restriction enzyme, S subunit